jgi:hypothetical protein
MVLWRPANHPVPFHGLIWANSRGKFLQADDDEASIGFSEYMA